MLVVTRPGVATPFTVSHFVSVSRLPFNLLSPISSLITPPSPVDTAHGVKLVTDWSVVYFANIFISLDTWVQVLESILSKVVLDVMAVIPVVPLVSLYLNPLNSIFVNALLLPIAAVA